MSDRVIIATRQDFQATTACSGILKHTHTYTHTGALAPVQLAPVPNLMTISFLFLITHEFGSYIAESLNIPWKLFGDYIN